MDQMMQILTRIAVLEAKVASIEGFIRAIMSNNSQNKVVKDKNGKDMEVSEEVVSVKTIKPAKHVAP